MPKSSDELGQATATDGGREVRRHSPMISTMDARWLIGIVVLVPIALTAGVYWLHQQPVGSQSRSGLPLVEVRLVQRPTPEPTPVVTTRPNQEASVGHPEPLVAAPNRQIPAETATTTSPPAVTPREPSLDRSAPATTRQRQVPSGSASAFQRLLLSHISRFQRYPHGAQSNQMHGTVQVVFAMRRDGTVAEAWVRKSSGHLLLDEAATETIRRAQPLPTIPADLPDTLTILLPVSFDAP